MNASRLRPPRAYCTGCHAAYRPGAGLVHRPLGARAQCPGIIRLAPNPGYWRICVWCYASGRYAARACPYCAGDGWLPAGSTPGRIGTALAAVRPG